MATVHLSIQESAIVVATLRLEDPDEFADAKPSEIVRAAERWLASRVERTDWACLNHFEATELANHHRTDRIIARLPGVFL